MAIQRREFLRLAGLVAGGAAISACSPIYQELSGLPRTIAGWEPIAASDYHVLSRLSYGPAVEEREQIISMGWKAWLEYQLAPEGIEDEGVLWRLRPYDSLKLEADALALREQEEVSLDLQSGGADRAAAAVIWRGLGGGRVEGSNKQAEDKSPEPAERQIREEQEPADERREAGHDHNGRAPGRLSDLAGLRKQALAEQERHAGQPEGQSPHENRKEQDREQLQKFAATAQRSHNHGEETNVDEAQ